MHALEGDGAGPTRHKHGRGIWWREFDGGVQRPNRATAPGLQRAAASSNRRSPEARRFELPPTVFRFKDGGREGEARGISSGSSCRGRSCGKRPAMAAGGELRGQPSTEKGRGNWSWAAVEEGREELTAGVIEPWWPVGGEFGCRGGAREGRAGAARRAGGGSGGGRCSRRGQSSQGGQGVAHSGPSAVRGSRCEVEGARAWCAQCERVWAGGEAAGGVL